MTTKTKNHKYTEAARQIQPSKRTIKTNIFLTFQGGATTKLAYALFLKAIGKKVTCTGRFKCETCLG